MAEECIHYSKGYVCQWKRSRGENYDVTSEWAKKYCWNYGYSDCPYYKQSSGSSGSSGCYLTSACVEALHKEDDCHELMLLRKLRDTYIKLTKDGEADMAHYYEVAPKIVEKIKAQDEPVSIFMKIYNELIAPCVELIEKGANEEAYRHYKAYSIELEAQYIG